ncbi:ketose-bisphosphate aldolase [Marinilactibacillus psychrotolerans]|uniref:ketose-bisphosphate aldolase n=1 Tax=Marinilactibacillus psychrotolerans TaxID=191770 RepID=UPI003885F74A
MLITMKELLTVADANKFAVPAFNAGTGQLLNSVMHASEEMNSPVIIAIHPDELKFLEEGFVAQVKYEANKTKIPVVLHLDHGANVEQVIHAIQLGFTSVMIDGSHFPFDENIELTKKVVDIAHAVGVSVEGELGTIGDTGDSGEGGSDIEDIIFTQPNEAKVFAERTGIDSLAIAIGTAHGLYPKDFVPELKLDLLDDIRKEVNIPLVLHGGSSNSDKEISRAVESGISKVNISSDIKIAFMDGVKEYFDKYGVEREPNVIYPSAMEKTSKVAKHKIELFNAKNKASLY